MVRELVNILSRREVARRFVGDADAAARHEVGLKQTGNCDSFIPFQATMIRKLS